MILRKIAYIFILLPLFSCFKSFSQADTAKRKLLVLPVITRSIETDWSFGAVGSYTFHYGKKDTLVRTSNQQALALYSLKKQLITAFNGSIYFPGEKYILNDQFSFSYFPDKFWGLGKSTPESNEESYTFKQYYVYLHFLTAIKKNLFAGVIFEYQNLLKIDYSKNGLFDKENITGRNGYKISGLGLSLTYDNRKNAFSPDKGSFIQVYFNHFMPVIGSDYSYTNIVMDVRQYYRIYKQQVLALQLYNFINLGSQVPLRSLASLGGANSMRGLFDGRYRDKNQLVLQAEYRMHVTGRFGAVVFAGTGDVGHTVTDYSLSCLKYSYGAGLRFAVDKKEKLNIRLDYGVAGRHNNGLYFQLGEAF